MVITSVVDDGCSSDEKVSGSIEFDSLVGISGVASFEVNSRELSLVVGWTDSVELDSVVSNAVEDVGDSSLDVSEKLSGASVIDWLEEDSDCVESFISCVVDGNDSLCVSVTELSEELGSLMSDGCIANSVTDSLKFSTEPKSLDCVVISSGEDVSVSIVVISLGCVSSDEEGTKLDTDSVAAPILEPSISEVDSEENVSGKNTSDVSSGYVNKSGPSVEVVDVVVGSGSTGTGSSTR